ncbi:fimbrial biogenesis chaperone [Raoultella terrigena]|uniref:fimbrial biogenesis chaperone n=1 Tax=Raoultella terrigena TaxID=577 RepID=UPI0009787B5C|nr:molecular chaperone [Raoultella terrigena]OMP91466.1 fimbrial protein [Raoultella terrigena]
MKIFKVIATLFIALFCVTSFAAGVSIAGTRLIYNENSHESDITVQNTNAADPVLIQSWVDNVVDQNKSPFIVTPPLFRLEAGSSNDLRVLLTSGSLPKDRESLFTLNIKVIPANTAQPGDNILQFAIKNQLKLIYRPSGLPGSALDAAKNLHWSQRGGQLHVENHSPYYVTVAGFTWAGHSLKTPIENSVLAPESAENYALPVHAEARQVSWQILDDFGASQTFSAPLSVR